jgi:hypothetical protein
MKCYTDISVDDYVVIQESQHFLNFRCSRSNVILNINTHLGAVTWLRRLDADHSPRRPVLAPGSVHVGFMVDSVGHFFELSNCLLSIPFRHGPLYSYHVEDEQRACW